MTDSVWTARKNNGQAIRVENNLPIVSLIFPLGENKKWDGNKLNAREEDEYEMMDIGRSFTQGSNDFQETVTVVQEDLPDIFVESKYKIEVYGKGQGLVYKEINLVNYRQGDDYGLQKVESGLRYFQTLIEYGKD
ncbi:MAG: hypothetical protein HC819_13220 [Cyclobacteriaceae bacterium]|nr:hypothetical protein [Cyclobacteriaceae bacterium]